MFFKKKKKSKKDETPEERHARIMRAKYASLMMGYHATADLLDEEEKKKARRTDQGSNSTNSTPVREPIHPWPSSQASASLA